MLESKAKIKHFWKLPKVLRIPELHYQCIKTSYFLNATYLLIKYRYALIIKSLGFKKNPNI